MRSEWDVTVESLDQPVVTHMPDTIASIVVCLPAATAAVVGPRMTATYSPGSPTTRLRLRLPPATALDVPAITLVGQIISLGRVPHDGLTSAEEASVMLRSLAIPPDHREPGHDVVRAATGLLADHGVRATAERLHVSERHLRALFTDHIGLSPKKYARLERVRAVLARIGEGDFARLAAELGYYDQSHLVNEFRAVMGIAPAAYAAGRRPPVTACAAPATLTRPLS